MLRAWSHVVNMRMLQVRNVPETIHRALKARAAQAGMTLSDFVLAELSRTLERPTRQELMKRLSRRAPVVLPESVVSILHQERDRS